MTDKTLPLLAISGYSGTGKTTLLQQLIPLLNERNIQVAVIKHSHHDVELDTPGKDSYVLRKAGANQTIIACDQRWTMITETPEAKQVDLRELIKRLDPDKTDIVLVEGFKHEPVAKIALFRDDVGKPFANIIDEYVIALASDKKYDVAVPLLDINKPAQIADFIIQWLKK